MADPIEVRPKNFEDHIILYNNGDFSIAFGTYEDRRRCVGMRWNGENDDSDVGYPKVFKNPVWFVLPLLKE
jgi:hypothetical protein